MYRRVRHYPTLAVFVGLCGATVWGCANATDGDGGAGGEGAAGGGVVSSTTQSVTVASSSSSTSSSVSSSAQSTTASTTVASTGSAMNNCGDGTIEPPWETCEGADFGGASCTDFGFAGGTLICNPYCNIVVSQCTPKESCNDNQDNDFDGFIDCADSECVAELVCTDPCAAPQFMTIPGWSWGYIAGEPAVLAPSCTGSSGQESVFQVTAVQDGDMSFTLWPYGFDGSISIRTSCNDPATEIACVNNAPSNGQESVLIQAVAGQTYYMIADSTTSAMSGDYSVQVDQPLPEQWCSGQWDDDYDGYVDCDDDTNCKGISFECQPGGGAYGTPCFSNNACQATGGDPICLDWNQGFPNGYCSEFCYLGVPGECGPNGVCMDVNVSVNGVCFKSCTVPSDCPSGTSCVDNGLGQMICDKPPEMNCQDYQDDDFDDFVDCEDPTSCKGISFSCTGGSTPVGGGCFIHQSCASTDGDPYCIDWWAGGYCTEFCDMSLDDCPSGSVCSDYQWFPSGNGLCMDECSQPSDCNPGYFCINWNGSNICVN